MAAKKFDWKNYTSRKFILAFGGFVVASFGFLWLVISDGKAEFVGYGVVLGLIGGWYGWSNTKEKRDAGQPK